MIIATTTTTMIIYSLDIIITTNVHRLHQRPNRINSKEMRSGFFSEPLSLQELLYILSDYVVNDTIGVDLNQK